MTHPTMTKRKYLLDTKSGNSSPVQQPLAKRRKRHHPRKHWRVEFPAAFNDGGTAFQAWAAQHAQYAYLTLDTSRKRYRAYIILSTKKRESWLRTMLGRFAKCTPATDGPIIETLLMGRQYEYASASLIQRFNQSER